MYYSNWVNSFLSLPSDIWPQMPDRIFQQAPQTEFTNLQRRDTWVAQSFEQLTRLILDFSSCPASCSELTVSSLLEILSPDPAHAFSQNKQTLKT